MRAEPENCVWIGLAEVAQRPGTGLLMDRNRAYVNVLALARTVTEFRRAVDAACSEIGFDLVKLEDMEPLARRAEMFVLNEHLLGLWQEVESSGRPRFGPFFTWTSED